MKCCVFLLLLAASVTNGIKILFLGPFNGKSHSLYCQTFITELLQRGHEVTYLTSNSMKNIGLKNYTEILVDPPLEIEKMLPQEMLFQRPNMNSFKNIWMMTNCPLMREEYALSTKNVQEFIKSESYQFDIVINEEFFHDAFLMFGHKFKVPTVTICPYGLSDFLERQQGLLTPWSHVPHMTLTYSDNMTFSERWFNTALSVFDWILRRWVAIPGHNAIAKKHFGHLGNIPSIDELHRNVSIIFVNNHRSIAPPRPLLPNIINIGGSHIKAPKPLPEDIQRFLDDAPFGAIYFSLGTIVKSSKMPADKLAALLGTFRNIKQKILWKYEDESLTDMPSNVLMKKWMPQSDILAHPNVRLFISHGGLFSTMESLDRGVPLLIIPFFGDQHRNGKRVENAGYGEVLSFADITEPTLTKLIEKMITSSEYLDRAKELQTVWKDNMVKPMDEFVWWIEHVVKFKGAKHLKTHAITISWISYLLIDVFAATFIAFLLIVFLFYSLLKKLGIGRTMTVVTKKIE